jgi:tocopherol O-methyltransferase
MTVNSTPAAPGDHRLFTELVEILAGVCSEGPEWMQGIAPISRLESDLRMESIEFTAFAEALRNRYGDRVELDAFFVELEIDQLIGLTVADVMAYVAARLPDSDSWQASR